MTPYFCGCRVKAHGPFAIADPDFTRARLKIKRRFVPQFRPGVRGRLDLDADFRGLHEAGLIAEAAPLLVGTPGDVDGFDAVPGGEGALRNHLAPVRELFDTGCYHGSQRSSPMGTCPAAAS